jgi:hypothetical protein
MTRKLTLNIRSFVLVISLIIIPVMAFGHGGGLDALGCHNNKRHAATIAIKVVVPPPRLRH